MIVVDTSVWIGAKRDPGVGLGLDSLIDADEAALVLPVRLELWAGVARKDRRALDRALSALAQVVPGDDTWARLPGWIERAADVGQYFSLSDLLIASLASDIDALIWSLDDDFVRMERLAFVQLYDPPLRG